jgi:hypothetical protein
MGGASGTDSPWRACGEWPMLVACSRGQPVPIKVVAYLQQGVMSGVIDSPEHLRDLLESSDRLTLTESKWAPFDGGLPTTSSAATIVIEDVAVAAGDEDLPGPVHAAFHPIRLEAGPYLIRGEMATLPGFDPGRALTRPTGTFVLLSDVKVSLLADANAGTASHDRALVNRYSVDRVDADLMLGFFFPGAKIEMPPPAPAPAAGAGTAAPPAATLPAATPPAAAAPPPAEPPAAAAPPPAEPPAAAAPPSSPSPAPATPQA